jgi:hypothetical protein
VRRQRGGDESEGARPRPRSAPSRSSSRAPHDPPGEAKKRISKASRRGGGGGRQRSLVLAPPSSSLSGSSSPPILLSIARPRSSRFPRAGAGTYRGDGGGLSLAGGAAAAKTAAAAAAGQRAPSSGYTLASLMIMIVVRRPPHRPCRFRLCGGRSCSATRDKARNPRPVNGRRRGAGSEDDHGGDQIRGRRRDGEGWISVGKMRCGAPGRFQLQLH